MWAEEYGSSPLARGTVQDSTWAVTDSRFIPACAGNGEPPAWLCGPTPVHPRLRGERASLSPSSPPRAGSSPLARGTAPWGRLDRACSAVHPRLRGERAVRPKKGCRISGSSPLARGTVARILSRFAARRFIPACAGNGIPGAERQGFKTVHPRLRGERGVAVIAVRVGCGSSPLARGTGGGGDSGHCRVRFIPACAGNGGIGAARLRFLPVHPRLRGERGRGGKSISCGAGSSPLARGTVERGGFGPTPGRFIPACAGNGVTDSSW